MVKQKLPLNIALEGNSPSVILSAVEAGLGFAALPFCSACRLYREGRVTLAPITELQVLWTFIQAREQPLSTAGERLKAFLQETIAERVALGSWRFAKLVCQPGAAHAMTTMSK